MASRKIFLFIYQLVNNPILDVIGFFQIVKGGSPGRTRTSDQSVNSRPLYQLSYRGTFLNGGEF